MTGANRETRRSPQLRIATRQTTSLAVGKMMKAGRSSWWTNIARVILGCVGHGKPQSVSARHIQKRCAERGIKGRYGRAPSNGQIDLVLRDLEAMAILTWARAHVPRWHGKLSYKERPRLYPRVNRNGLIRVPARCVQLIGDAALLAASAMRAHLEEPKGRAEKNPEGSSNSTYRSAPAALESDAGADLEAAKSRLEDFLGWKPRFFADTPAKKIGHSD